jgi:uncharacterized membrane protein
MPQFVAWRSRRATATPTLAGMDHFTPVVALHAGAALIALGLGAFVFLRRKGTAAHRWLGRSWAILMLAVAVSSFWITGQDGQYSWIHGLSAFVTAGVPFAVVLAATGKVSAHRRLMTGMYIGGLVVAGLFTLLPSRLLGRMLWSAVGIL